MLGMTDELGTLRPGVVGRRLGAVATSAAASCCATMKTQVVAERLLQPVFCLRAGKRYDADAVILPQAVAA